MHELLALSLSLLALAGPAAAAVQEAEQLGRVVFPSSGAPAAQEPFLRGVLLLHSFEYEDAREAFQGAQALDPSFALAYWGEALTHSHPLWREEDVDAARAALARLAPTPAERAAKAGSERERRFLGAVERLFGEGDRIERHRAYAEAMGALWADDPHDLEAGAFGALAILGTSLGLRDERVYMRAAAVGEEVYRKDPLHPGALHYLIHCYDDPVHAPLGLRMARAYDKVAPSATHALHMPSHIYVALGLWDESAAANEHSVAAARARCARKGLDFDGGGWHALWWLHYTALQQGRMEAATALLREAEDETRAAGSERAREHLVRMRSQQLVATQEWDGAAARLAIDLDGLSRPTVAADLCVRGLAHVGRGELAEARQVLATMRGASPWEGVTPLPGATLASCCAPASAVQELVDGPGRTAAEVLARELEGAIRLAAGEEREGLALLRGAAELEDTMGFDFGPPLVVVPAHEILGAALLERGDAAGAVSELEAALARAPRRARSLLLLARAADASGDPELARRTRAELAAIWHAADAPLAPPREASSSKGAAAER